MLDKLLLALHSYYYKTSLVLSHLLLKSIRFKY